jgi:hypothetical protein
MTIERVAAVLILASQLVLLAMAFDTTGANAILFSFVGHPLLVVGLGLAIWSLWRRRQTTTGAEAATDRGAAQETRRG